MPDSQNESRYKLGVFYFDQTDPRLLVRKRFGVGRTLNFARPATLLILVMAIVRLFSLQSIRQ